MNKLELTFTVEEKKLSQKQLYNTHGFCSNYEPKEQIKKPQTNEEYIRTCSTEELAKLIYKIAVTDVLMDRFFTAEIVNAEIVDVDSGIKEAETWLKEKHNEMPKL